MKKEEGFLIFVILSLFLSIQTASAQDVRGCCWNPKTPRIFCEMEFQTTLDSCCPDPQQYPQYYIGTDPTSYEICRDNFFKADVDCSNALEVPACNEQTGCCCYDDGGAVYSSPVLPAKCISPNIFNSGASYCLEFCGEPKSKVSKDCFDNDPIDNPFFRGTVTLNEGNKSIDECDSKAATIEYSCYGSVIVGSVSDCPTGTECYGGVCKATSCDNDNIAEAGEECDGTDLRGYACGSFGFYTGTLNCSNGCEFGVTSCLFSSPTEYCSEWCFDADRDSDIDITDIKFLNTVMNSEKGKPDYNNCYDLNDDGIVDGKDLFLLLERLGSYEVNNVDNDEDGFSPIDVKEWCSGLDCNDSDATVNPLKYEICDDAKDNDCDGLVDGKDYECKILPPAMPLPSPEVPCSHYYPNNETGCIARLDCEPVYTEVKRASGHPLGGYVVADIKPSVNLFSIISNFLRPIITGAVAFTVEKPVTVVNASGGEYYQPIRISLTSLTGDIYFKREGYEDDFVAYSVPIDIDTSTTLEYYAADRDDPNNIGDVKTEVYKLFRYSGCVDIKAAVFEAIEVEEYSTNYIYANGQLIAKIVEKAED